MRRKKLAGRDRKKVVRVERQHGHMNVVVLPLANTEFWTKVTGIGTLALASISLLLLVPTVIGVWLTSRDARKDLQATREAAKIAQEAAQRQIEASYRPLLIDVARHGPIYDDMGTTRQSVIRGGRAEPVGPPFITLRFPSGDETMHVDPRMVLVAFQPGRVQIMVSLRNVGWGLAVIDPEGLRVAGDGLGGVLQCEVQRERVPPSETTRVLCECELVVREQPPPGPCAYDVRVPYRDFAEGQLTVAVVRVEGDPAGENEWQIRSVKQRKHTVKDLEGHL